MKVLGIDYSLNGTGLSVYDGDSITCKKVFTNAKNINEVYKDIFIQIPKFEKMYEKLDWVCKTIIDTNEYDFVCMEDHIGKYYDWMDGYAILKHYLRLKDIPYICVAPAQLKKYAGSGKADKTQMSYYLRAEYNFDLDYLGDSANNIVDATWLAILGFNYFKKYKSNKSIKVSKERSEILIKIAQKQK